MTNKELFIQAFLEADAIEMQPYQNKDHFHYEFSEAFEKKMNKIIAKDKRLSFYTRKKISKAFFAAMIALMIMFMGSLIVSATQGKMIKVIEHKTAGYIDIRTASDSFDVPSYVLKEYTLSHIPDGFTVTEDNTEATGVSTLWQNDLGEEIDFSQIPLKFTISIDSDQHIEKVKVNGNNAYLFRNQNDGSIIWTNGEYSFWLTVPVRYYDELISMAETVCERSE